MEMKALRLASLMLALMLPAAALAAPVEVKLDFQRADDPANPLLQVTRGYWGSLPARPSGVSKVPSGLEGKVTYYQIGLFDPAVVFVVDSATPPRLYADTDRDGDLAEEQAFVGRAGRGLSLGDGAGYGFGPITLSPAAPGAAPVQVAAELAELGAGQRYLMVRPAGVRSGRIALPGGTYLLAVADVTMDGRYDEAWTPERISGCDWIGIDRNRNGRFELGVGQQSEAFPLPGLLQVGGAYYNVHVAADGSSATLGPTEVEFGTLDIGGASVEMGLLSTNGPFRLQAGDGPYRLPAGRYRTTSIMLRKRRRDTTWVLTSSYPQGPLSGFSIGPGATTSLEVGEPLKGEVTMTPRAGQAQVGFAVVGRGGEEYGAGAMSDGRRQPAPTFQIKNDSGDVLARGSFAYG